MGEFALKDLFQFGVPTALLGILLCKGPAVIERIIDKVMLMLERLSVPFLTAIREGFSKIEKAVEGSNTHWAETLKVIHKENREDIAMDQKLRHDTNAVMQVALRAVEDHAEHLQCESRRLQAEAAKAVVHAVGI